MSGPLMTFFDGHSHLRGWQWLFLVEGLPSIALGIFVYFYLQDKPEEARWLSTAEKQLVSEALQMDTIGGMQPESVWQVLRYWRVYLLGLIFFLAITGTYVLAFWQPLLDQGFRSSRRFSDQPLFDNTSHGRGGCEDWSPIFIGFEAGETVALRHFGDSWGLRLVADDDMASQPRSRHVLADCGYGRSPRYDPRFLGRAGAIFIRSICSERNSSH